MGFHVQLPTYTVLTTIVHPLYWTFFEEFQALFVQIMGDHSTPVFPLEALSTTSE